MKQYRYVFSVNLSYQECEELYRKHIKFLLVTDVNGKRIQLPKQNMQKYVTPIGLKGRFELFTSVDHKILSISPINN